MMKNKEITNNQRQKLDKLLIQLYCKNYDIIIDYTLTNSFQNDGQQETVAMFLTRNQKLIPQQWLHDYHVQNDEYETLQDIMIENRMPIPQNWTDKNKMSIFDQAYFGIIPNINEHKPDDQDNNGFTVAMLLALNSIEIPEQWKHKPELQNKYGFTVAMYYAQNKTIPKQYWVHDPGLQNINGDTVAMLFAKNGLVPHKDWEHDSLLQNNNKETVAIIFAYQRILPPKQWFHNPQHKNKQRKTVAVILIENGIIPPIEWCYDPHHWGYKYRSLQVVMSCNNLIMPNYLIKMNNDTQNIPFNIRRSWAPIPSQNQETNPTIFDQAMMGQIPVITGHQPEEQDWDGWTVAMILTFQGIIPPRQWMHNYNIKNRYDQTLQDIMKRNNMPIPTEWQDINKMNIFDQAVFGMTLDIDNHKPEETNEQGFTVAMIQAYNGKIPDQQWYHNKYLRSKTRERQTVKNILEMHNLWIPDEWFYPKLDFYENNYPMVQAKNGIIFICKSCDPTYQNNYGETLAMILADNRSQVPKEWQHDPYINQENQTIFEIYINKGMESSKWTYLNPNWQNEYHDTQALLLASKNLNIPSELYHDPSIQNKYGYTVAIYQASYGKIPDKQWYYKQDFSKTYQFQTVALNLAMNGIIPPKEWYHNKFLRRKINNKQYYTVQNYLQEQNIQVPQEWKYDNIVDDRDNTQAMLQAQQGIVPYKQFYHDPKQTNKNNQTVAQIFIEKQILPPREWFYDSDISQFNYQSIKDQLVKNQLPIPQHWKQEEQLTIFDQAYFRQIPDINGHNSDEQTEEGFTIAMILTINNIEVPKEWHHDPNIQNKYNMTVAMYQFRNGKIPDKQWQHKPELQDYNESTLAMYMADKGIVPPKQWEHDPLIQNKYNQIVPFYLINNCIIPPIQWIKEPKKQYSKNRQTIAMILANNQSILLPDYCYHDPTIQDFNGNTVAMILAQNQLIPPKQWYHDEKVINLNYKTLQYYLNKQKTNFRNCIIFSACKSIKQNDVCQLCFEQKEQDFVQSTCGHQICIQCFYKIINFKYSIQCPICNKNDWYIIDPYQQFDQ